MRQQLATYDEFDEYVTRLMNTEEHPHYNAYRFAMENQHDLDDE